jgi:rhodanese-related sulfurtransferase
VREPWENEEFNIGGELIPVGSLMEKIPELEKYKDEEIIVYCRSGNRSGMAQMILNSAGFSNVRNLLGGMLDWENVFGR